MSKLYVGIDISKDKSSANGIDEHGKSHFEISFAMDGGGFADPDSICYCIKDKFHSFGLINRELSS